MSEDTIAGHVQRMMKSDGSESGLLLVKLYALDELGQQKTRKWTDKNGSEHEAPVIAQVLRLPVSTISKVINGQAKRCLMFLKV